MRHKTQSQNVADAAQASTAPHPPRPDSIENVLSRLAA